MVEVKQLLSQVVSHGDGICIPAVWPQSHALQVQALVLFNITVVGNRNWVCFESRLGVHS